jgi:hypothetical protein
MDTPRNYAQQVWNGSAAAAPNIFVGYDKNGRCRIGNLLHISRNRRKLHIFNERDFLTH